jgi:hypothetical protein
MGKIIQVTGKGLEVDKNIAASLIIFILQKNYVHIDEGYMMISNSRICQLGCVYNLQPFNGDCVTLSSHRFNTCM